MNELTNQPIKKLYQKYLIPTLLGILSNSLYCLVDVYFIAKGAGNMGLAALNICMPVFTAYSAIGLLFGVGSATIMSIAEGSKEWQTRNKAFTLGLFFMVILGLCFTIYTALFIESFAFLLGSSTTLLPYVTLYLKPITLSAIPFIIMYALSILLRSDHNPKLAMYALMCANFANIILDYVFVVGCQWGIFGAAFATALSPVISLSIATFHFLFHKNSVHFTLHFFDFSILKRIIKNGLGSGLMEISAGSVILIFNAVILMISNEIYLAAFSIITNVAYVLKGILIGFAQAGVPIMATNYGANQPKRTLETLQQTLLYSSLFSLLLYVLFLCFPQYVAMPFANGDQQLIQISVVGIRIYFSCTIFLSFNIMIMYYFQSIEAGNHATFIAIMKGFVFLILALILLVPWFQIHGVWFSITFAESLTSLLTIGYYYQKKYNH